MKHSPLAIAVGALALFVWVGIEAGASHAQSAPPPAPPTHHESRGKALERWNSEHSLRRGAFGRHLRRQALKRGIRRERREALRAKFDRDQSGRLEPAEREAARAELRAKLQQLKQRYDADQNGRLEPQERAALRDELKSLRQARVQERRGQR